MDPTRSGRLSSTSPEPVEDPGPKECHFAKLPLELRRHIYGYVLKASHPIHSYWMNKPSNPNFAALLSVNRRINQEATPVLYDVNTIRFVNRTLPVPFDDSHQCPHIDIPNRLVPLLRKVVVSEGYYLSPTSELGTGGMNLLTIIEHLRRDAPNLQYLTYFVWDAYGHAFHILRHIRTFARLDDLASAIVQVTTLKEFTVVSGTLHEDQSNTVRVAEPRVFPGVMSLRRTVETIVEDLRNPITVEVQTPVGLRLRTCRPTFKVSFIMV